MKYYAHTAEDGEGNLLPEDSGKWQPLAVHLRNVARRARAFAEPLGLAAEAELAGWLHDLGKYAGRFQQRLRDPRIRGINHWAAGAVHAYQTLKAPLVGFAIDGHHPGIPAANDFRQTLLAFATPQTASSITGYDETVADLLGRFAADGLHYSAPGQRPVERPFAVALRARMLFSCLVDADFLDTEVHFDPHRPGRRQVPALEAERAFELVRTRVDSLPTDGPVNALRRRLLEDCLAAAERSPGLFTLTAPTGSGKTLASLAFALKHILGHNRTRSTEDPRRLRRVIVVIPYTSIIEQNAAVYRALFESDFGPDYVLEHHSAVAPREREQERAGDAEEERLRRARLAAENWASPVVVTTSVRFFESLFSNKPSECRRLHNIARSVVLFDEVQTLPHSLVPSLLSAVRLLVRDYGVSAVFLSATQPAFNAVPPEALPFGWEPIEISTDQAALAEALCRTHIELPGPGATVTWCEVAARLAAESQVLCVVNSTRDARELFRRLPPQDRFHLSSRLCPAHRQEKLREIRDRLAASQPVRLVSTQLIEAGVDVDFPVAFRAFGPLDSIIQTAGRCNREGRAARPRPVVVFRPQAGGSPPGAYQVALAKTEEFLHRHPAAPLHQPDTYAAYFRELYALTGRDRADADTVFRLSDEFNFPAAAAACRLIDDRSRAVLVKWGDGANLAEKLRRGRHLTADECRRAQRFTVNLFRHEVFRDAAGQVLQPWIVRPADGWDFLLWNSDYEADLGACHPDGLDLVL